MAGWAGAPWLISRRMYLRPSTSSSGPQRTPWWPRTNALFPMCSSLSKHEGPLGEKMVPSVGGLGRGGEKRTACGIEDLLRADERPRKVVRTPPRSGTVPASRSRPSRPSSSTACLASRVTHGTMIPRESDCIAGLSTTRCARSLSWNTLAVCVL